MSLVRLVSEPARVVDVTRLYLLCSNIKVFTFLILLLIIKKKVAMKTIVRKLPSSSTRLMIIDDLLKRAISMIVVSCLSSLTRCMTEKTPLMMMFVA